MKREIIAGATLAAARKQSGISQHDMGKLIDLTQTRVSQLEQDPSAMRMSMLRTWYNSVNSDGKELVLQAITNYICA